MAFDLYAKLSLDGKSFASGLSTAQSQARRTGAQISKEFQQSAVNLKNAFAGAFTVGALTAASKKTIEYAGHIAALAAQLDISTDALQQWNFAATQNGATADDAAKFFEKLGIKRKQALEGSDDAIAAFQKFGVTIDDLKSKRLEEIGLKISQAFRTGDVQKLSADLADLASKGATGLIPAFVAGIAEMGEEAKRLGQILEKGVVEQLDEVGDKLDQLAGKMRGPLADGIVFLVDRINDLGEFFQLAGGFSVEGPKNFGQYLLSPKASALLEQIEKEETPPPRPPRRSFLEDIEEKAGAGRFPRSPAQTAAAVEAAGSVTAVDSLARIGGFSQTADSGMKAIAQKSLDQLQQINVNTAKSAEAPL